MNEVNKAYASVQDLSTPSDMVKLMKWIKLMLLSKTYLHRQTCLNEWSEQHSVCFCLSNICLHRQTRLNEWSEKSLCFCPRFVYTVGHVYICSFVAMSADSVPSSKTNIFQIKLIYCRHFRTYSRCALFDWNDTVFRRRNVTRRRISNTVLQPRYWGREADSPEVWRLSSV